MKKPYVLWSAHPYAEEVLRILKGAKNRTLCFSDLSGNTGSGIPGIRVVRRDELTTLKEKNIAFVVPETAKADAEKELAEIFGQKCPETVSIRQWICELLADSSIVLMPYRARLDICTLCQLRCVSCYMRNDPRETTGAGYVPVQVFEKFLTDNPFIEELEISNSGEPFLHPQMHEIIRAAHEHGVKLSCWNGTNFNDVSEEVLRDIVECGFGDITIGIDGTTQESYAKYRRNGDLSKVFENIEKLNAVKKSCHTEYPRLFWQFIVMSHNYREMEAAERMAEEMGMYIRFRQTWSRPEREKTEALMAAEGKTVPSGEKNNYFSYCRDLFEQPQVNWDGRLLGCCQIYRSDWGMNVFSDGLIKCVNSPVYKETLRRLGMGETVSDPAVPCSTCRRQRMPFRQ